MAAPRGGLYVAPKSSPLAGQIFSGQLGTTQAYNRYLEADARSRGFAGYSELRRFRTSPEYKARVAQVKAAGGGKPVPVARRQDILQRVASFIRGGGRGGAPVQGPQRWRLFQYTDPTTGASWTVNPGDRRRGGTLDRYLIAIGRRTGSEPWLPGETP